jgi:hypothetical protein
MRTFLNSRFDTVATWRYLGWPGQEGQGKILLPAGSLKFYAGENVYYACVRQAATTYLPTFITVLLGHFS